MAVTSDQNIIVYDVSNAASSGEPLPKIKQLVGYNEEVLEFAFLDGPDGELSRLAVATNSEQVGGV